MKKKCSFLLIIILLGLFYMVGCGKKDTTSKKNDDDQLPETKVETVKSIDYSCEDKFIYVADNEFHSIDLKVLTEDVSIKYSVNDLEYIFDELPKFKTGDYTIGYKISKEGYNTVTDLASLIIISEADIIDIEKITVEIDSLSSSIELPSGYEFVDNNVTKFTKTGLFYYSVKYKTINKEVKCDVQIEVKGKTNLIKPEFDIPTNLTATYGDTLSDIALPTGFSFVDDLATSVGNAGVNSFQGKFTPNDLDRYSIENVNIEINVAKATPKYIVPTNLTATYGDTLADVTLPTGFSFENLLIGVGNVGDNKFKVIFTPLDSLNYEIITDIDITISVCRATPTYTSPTNLTATYGDTLADIILPIGFSFEEELTTSVGNPGNNNFYVTYSPRNSTNYKSINNIAVTINVGKATPTYTAPTNLTATYGDTLADIILPIGFSFEEELTTSVGNVGHKETKVTYMPSDLTKYNVVTNINVTINVDKANYHLENTIVNLSALVDCTLGDVSENFDEPGYTFVLPLDTVIASKIGTYDYYADFTYSSNYNTIHDIIVRIKVEALTPVVNNQNFSVEYDTLTSSIVLPEGYSMEEVRLSGTYVAGQTYTFNITYTPSDLTRYKVTAAKANITIKKSTYRPTLSTYEAPYLTTLNDVSLPAGYVFQGDYEFLYVGEIGLNTHLVDYVPFDKKNYTSYTDIEVKINVVKAEPSLPFQSKINANTLDTLGSVSNQLTSGYSFVDSLSTKLDTVGSFTFDLIYTPSDSTHYYAIESDVLIIVTQYIKNNVTFISEPKTFSVYSDSNYSILQYVTKLSDIDIHYEASVPGTMAWDCEDQIIVDNGQRNYVFTPDDTTHYNVYRGAVQVTYCPFVRMKIENEHLYGFGEINQELNLSSITVKLTFCSPTNSLMLFEIVKSVSDSEIFTGGETKVYTFATPCQNFRFSLKEDSTKYVDYELPIVHYYVHTQSNFLDISNYPYENVLVGLGGFTFTKDIVLKSSWSYVVPRGKALVSSNYKLDLSGVTGVKFYNYGDVSGFSEIVSDNFSTFNNYGKIFSSVTLKAINGGIISNYGTIKGNIVLNDGTLNNYKTGYITCELITVSDESYIWTKGTISSDITNRGKLYYITGYNNCYTGTITNKNSGSGPDECPTDFLI